MNRITKAMLTSRLEAGATYIHATTLDEYDAVTTWICENGGTFAYHFEVGEGFHVADRIVEVDGL